MKYSNPLKKMHVTSSFGPRIHPIHGINGFHSGVDLRANYEKTFAIDEGVVEKVREYPQGIGKYIVINHVHFTTVYGHLSEFKVREGQTVKNGEIIATTGNSGASTAPHLHFEVRIGNPGSKLWHKNNKGMYYNAIDPITFLPGEEEPKEKHFADSYYEFLTKDLGIKIHETRFDDNITRGEVFALLARLEGYKE